MKKLLALMFAVALTVSMSSFAFAQAGGDKPADKKEEKKEKKAAKKKEKKEKKAEEKKDGHLCGEGFRRGDADLRAGEGVECAVRLAGNGSAGNVRDGDIVARQGGDVHL